MYKISSLQCRRTKKRKIEEARAKQLRLNMCLTDLISQYGMTSSGTILLEKSSTSQT
jgi:hypothetical protein